jgi:hypothetical protein
MWQGKIFPLHSALWAHNFSSMLLDDYVVWDLGRMHITYYSCVSVYCIMSLEFYKHCLFYVILPSWMTRCTFSTYSWVYLMMDHLNVKIHNQSVATFEACMLFRGLCFTHGVITKGSLSILWVSEASFSTKLNANSLFLKLYYFTGLQISQDALNTHN